MNGNFSYKKFVTYVSGSGFIFLIIFILIKHFFLNALPAREFLISWVLSAANALIGAKLVSGSLNKPRNKFMINSFGSMTVRLFATILIFMVLIIFLKPDRFYFVFSFFFFYFFYLFFEIVFLIKVSKQQTQS